MRQCFLHFSKRNSCIINGRRGRHLFLPLSLWWKILYVTRAVKIIKTCHWTETSNNIWIRNKYPIVRLGIYFKLSPLPWPERWKWYAGEAISKIMFLQRDDGPLKWTKAKHFFWALNPTSFKIYKKFCEEIFTICHNTG